MAQAGFAATKFMPPLVSAALVERARLVHRLDQAVTTAPVTLVVGFPGSGKTVLATQWLAARTGEGAVAWLSCDESDARPPRFWVGLVEAVRRVHPTLGTDALDLLEVDGSAGDEFVASLVNDLAGLEEPLVVVVDDLHLAGVGTAPVLSRLVSLLPAAVHLVLVSRTEPALPLHRWRVDGRLAEIRDIDLRFAEPEAAALTRQRGLTLEPETVSELNRHTEGWAAGLQLALLSVHGLSDPDAFLRGFAATDRAVADYLVGEVLERQPDDVVDFLLATALVERLDAGLCEALTGRPDAADMLRRIEDSGLFLLPVDRERRVYRYHSLFAELLRYRLRARDPDRERTLHRLAADWLEHHGDIESALQHAFRAGDLRRAVTMIQARVVEGYLLTGDVAIGRWLSELDDDVIGSERDLALEDALLLTLSGSLDEAGAWIQRLGVIVPAAGDDALAARFAAVRSMWHGMRGEAGAAIADVDEARRLSPPGADDVVDALATVEMRVRMYADDLEGARAIYETDARNRVLPETLHGVVLTGALAAVESEAGALREASALADRAVALADRAGMRGHYATADALRTLGAIAYERNDLDAADIHLEESVAISERGRPSFALLGMLELARLFLGRGDRDAAFGLIDRARHVLPSGVDSPLIARIDAAAARVHLAIGDVEEAARCAASVPEGTRRLFLDVRVDLARRDPGIAGARLGRLDARRETLRARIEHALLAARIAADLGSDDRAGLVHRAIDLARPERFVRSFVDEGPEFADLLDATLHHTSSEPYEEELSAALRRAIPIAAAAPLTSDVRFTLTDRERVVLRHLATRMSNREIASELYVSVNTLKTHIRSVYRKLEASSRSEALDRARQARLL